MFGYFHHKLDQILKFYDSKGVKNALSLFYEEAKEEYIF